jgi:hypothetical protein
MTLTRAIVLFVGLVVTIAGCSGGSTPAEDAAVVGHDDTGVVAMDSGTPGNDAFVAGDDAFVAPDDAFVTPADDTGSTASGACTNTADMTRLGMPGLSTIIETCTRPFGAEPRTRDCIRMMSGLTMACADCFDGTVRCTIQHCAGQCAGGDSPACTTCRMTNCDAPFTACSGTAP